MTWKELPRLYPNGNFVVVLIKTPQRFCDFTIPEKTMTHGYSYKSIVGDTTTPKMLICWEGIIRMISAEEVDICEVISENTYRPVI